MLQIKSKNESTIQNEYNCLWDSFFIHLRNLLNFFKSTGRKDDLLCGDIFKDNINTKQLKVSFTIEYEINDCYYKRLQELKMENKKLNEVLNENNTN